MSIKENSKLAQLLIQELKDTYNLDVSIVEKGGYNNLQAMFLIALYNTDASVFKNSNIAKDVKVGGQSVHKINSLEQTLIRLRGTEDKTEEEIVALGKLEKFDKLMKIGFKIVASQTNVDITPYITHDFTFMQVFQILLNLMNGLDPAYYAKPEYSSRRMRVIQLALINGHDLDKYLDLKLTDNQLYEMYFAKEEEIKNAK